MHGTTKRVSGRYQAMETNLRNCGEAAETRERFIFHCCSWSDRRKFLGCGQTNTNSRAYSEASPPRMLMTGSQIMSEVRTVSHFALITKRFGRNTSDQLQTTRWTLSKDWRKLPRESLILHHPHTPSCTRQVPTSFAGDGTMNTCKHSFKSTRRPLITRTRSKVIHICGLVKVLEDNMCGVLLALVFADCI
jgi:hypothetical protein